MQKTLLVNGLPSVIINSILGPYNSSGGFVNGGFSRKTWQSLDWAKFFDVRTVLEAEPP